MDKKSYNYQLHVIQRMTGSDATLKIESSHYCSAYIYIHIHMRNKEQESLLKKNEIMESTPKGMF